MLHHLKNSILLCTIHLAVQETVMEVIMAKAHDNNGESAGQLNEKIKGHNGQDRNSIENEHDLVLKNGFNVFENGYNNNVSKRKIGETLLIKKLEPSLNVQ